jgi:hypothetical protein
MPMPEDKGLAPICWYSSVMSPNAWLPQLCWMCWRKHRQNYSIDLIFSMMPVGTCWRILNYKYMYTAKFFSWVCQLYAPSLTVFVHWQPKMREAWLKQSLFYFVNVYLNLYSLWQHLLFLPHSVELSLVIFLNDYRCQIPSWSSSSCNKRTEIIHGNWT